MAGLEGLTALENTHARADSPREKDRRILRIGHRGAAGHAPENTIAAIRKGISLGVDFVELDVQRTRDGRLVLMHDALVDRTTDGTGPVSELTWKELQMLDAGDGEGIPCLEAALAAASWHAGVILEAKAAGIGPAMLGAVRGASFPGEVIYASFLHAEIFEIRGLDPRARTMALMECVPLSGAAFAREAKASLAGLAHDSATARFIATLHDARVEVLLYTVNKPRLIQRGIDLGADGIISDYPELVPVAG